MNYPNTHEPTKAKQTKSLEDYAERIMYFDRAILEAQASQSLAAEAIAQKQAAEFFLEWGKEKIAAVYMQDAYSCYARSGAISKTKSLEHHYPQLLQPILELPQSEREKNCFTDDFIATISHEFRNPLNGILGMSETLLEEVYGAMNEQQLNAVSTIDRSGWYLLALINNMTDLAKIQANTLELEIANVSVVELCLSSTTFVKHHAIQKKIQLDTEIAPDIGYIAVDIQRMRQVLINLIGQAIESTPIGGSVKLVVTKHQTDKKDHTTTSLQFAVIDTSKEIPTVPHPQFAPVTPQGQRVGFGLMLVHPIVELHGGSLSSQSTIGRGSCTNVLLPFNCLVPDSTVEQSGFSGDLSIFSGDLTQDSCKLPLILIAEDNELNINTIFSYLTAKHYRPIVAQDGQSAIEMTQKFHPDLILMDIQMPGMDGLEAITHIRQQPALKLIPIIALTALAMEGDRTKCLAAGANEYISKPIKLKQLNDVIRKLLKSDKLPTADNIWD
jgi:signal transduction histidine kinase/ActR/RegA family two-component response regulator